MMRVLTNNAPLFPLAPASAGERAGVRGCQPRKQSLMSSCADRPPHPALSPAEAAARDSCEVPSC
jgi:hypothetical protein